MKQLTTIFGKTLNLFTKQFGIFFKNNNEINARTLPARWALVPVKNNKKLF